MEIKTLERRKDMEENKKLLRKYKTLQQTIEEIKQHDIPEHIADSINREINQIESFTGGHEDLAKRILKTQSKILKQVEKELQLVPKNHYRNQWLALGMAAFGIPVGVAFGISFDSMAFLGMGLPIGMIIGMAIGSVMDKKTVEKGKQLNIEL